MPCSRRSSRTRRASTQPTLAEIQRYTKLFWINNGPYHNLTAQKFVLKTTPQAFAAAAKSAAQAGATLPGAEGESLDAMLARLQPMFFDPAVDPIVTNKTPGPGEDLLTASANNLYSGVSMADLKGFTEKYPLNSRLVKQNGRLVEEVYRIDGRYGPQITEIVKHLEAAIPYATEPMANALRALIQWYRTGEDADRVKYDIAWVRDKASPVDTINGFIEVYLDARGIKGSWEGARLLREPGEDRADPDAGGQRAVVRGSHALGRQVPESRTSPASSPTPSTSWSRPAMRARSRRSGSTCRTTTGSARSTAASRSRCRTSASRTTTRTRARRAASSRGRRKRRSVPPSSASLAGELHTDMHEVIGHASGRQSPALKGTPQAALKEHASALEEARADLVALYFIADPKLVELGVIPAADHDAITRTEYESYTRIALMQLLRVGRDATQLEQDHMRNRQMVVRWLMANTKADRAADARRQDLLRDGGPAGVPRGRRPAPRRGAADQGRGRLRGSEEAVRHVRRALRSEAARRSRSRAWKSSIRRAIPVSSCRS